MLSFYTRGFQLLYWICIRHFLNPDSSIIGEKTYNRKSKKFIKNLYFKPTFLPLPLSKKVRGLFYALHALWQLHELACKGNKAFRKPERDSHFIPLLILSIKFTSIKAVLPFYRHTDMSMCLRGYINRFMKKFYAVFFWSFPARIGDDSARGSKPIMIPPYLG